MSDEQAGAILIGREFGHYRITKPLGRGGMGDVYLAEDTRLGRKVALKFLPTSLGGDSTRAQRFEHEALAASALNHPNIVTVHEFGSDHGQQFLVTEYVEGKTLREALHEPTFRLEDALRIAEGTALALSAAHKAGIVHRDVKPENIMLREDGIVKVLDFGLAKFAPSPRDLTNLTPSSADSELETRQHVTLPGSVLGTVLYMSPEQARGKEVDARTDVWSLGVVIYEMLAGLPPFVGETSSDVIAAILRAEAPPLVPRLGAIPGEIGRLVQKALQKDRNERYQDMRDLVNDLRDAQRQMNAPAGGAGTASLGGPQEPAGGRTSGVRPRAWRHKRLMTAAAATLAVVLAGFWLLTSHRPGPGFVPVPLRPAPAPVTLTALPIDGDVREATISPDGRLVAYVRRDGISETVYVQPASLAGPATAVVPASETGWRSLSFSPDGSRLFLRTNPPTSAINELYQVPVAGGLVRRVITDVDSIASFAPGGDRFVFRRDYPDRRESCIMLANVDGSGERTLATRHGHHNFVNSPAWSPDGRTVASLARDPGAVNEQQRYLVVIDALDGAVKVLGKARWRWTTALTWVPDGSELLIVGRDQPEDPFHVWRVGYPGGDVLNATDDANTYDGVSVPADASALLTMRISQTSALFTAPLADLERARQLTPETAASFYGLDWTHDGRVLYGSSDGGYRNIWVATGHGAAVRLTTGEFVKQNPVATPDGRYIVYLSEQGGYANIWRMNADGSGARQLTFGETANNPSVTPDSRWVVYDAASVGATRLFKVSVDGGTPDELTSVSSHYPAVSPDGKVIAFWYNPGGTAASTLSIVGIGGYAAPQLPRAGRRLAVGAWGPGAHLR